MFYGMEFQSLERVTYMLSIFRQNAEADLNRLSHYWGRKYHPAFGWSLDDLYAIPF
jgi:hypothetical protein